MDSDGRRRSLEGVGEQAAATELTLHGLVSDTAALTRLFPDLGLLAVVEQNDQPPFGELPELWENLVLSIESTESPRLD